jgi:antitoxin YefM
MTMKLHEYVPVSTAKARLLELLRRMEEQHSNVVLTRNGIPTAVLLSYDEFQGLIETIDILSDSSTMEGIKKGLKDVREGRVVSLKEAFED